MSKSLIAILLHFLAGIVAVIVGLILTFNRDISEISITSYGLIVLPTLIFYYAALYYPNVISVVISIAINAVATIFGLNILGLSRFGETFVPGIVLVGTAAITIALTVLLIRSYKYNLSLQTNSEEENIARRLSAAKQFLVVGYICLLVVLIAFLNAFFYEAVLVGAFFYEAVVVGFDILSIPIFIALAFYFFNSSQRFTATKASKVGKIMCGVMILILIGYVVSPFTDSAADRDLERRMARAGIREKLFDYHSELGRYPDKLIELNREYKDSQTGYVTSTVYSIEDEDPKTGQRYFYRSLNNGSDYELCIEFEKKGRECTIAASPSDTIDSDGSEVRQAPFKGIDGYEYKE